VEAFADGSLERRELLAGAATSLVSIAAFPRVARADEPATTLTQVYNDEEDKYSLAVPGDWERALGDTSPNPQSTRKVVAFYPQGQPEINVNVVATALGADYPKMGSFGSPDEFAFGVAAGMTRPKPKQGPKQFSYVLDAKNAGDRYVIEYTVERPEENFSTSFFSARRRHHRPRDTSVSIPVERFRMPIDYSKWDDIDSDSDDETPPKPAPAAQKKGTSDATAAAPASSVEFDKKSKQEATGSAWNMNSWHFEETKLDEWGRARLKELLHRAPVSEYIDVDGLELDLDAKIVCREVKGDCWVHVRKGKKVWGHDFDCAIDWAGAIRGGSGLQIHGFAEWNWAVDDEEIEIPRAHGSGSSLQTRGVRRGEEGHRLQVRNVCKGARGQGTRQTRRRGRRRAEGG
jgi:hypothetical protein